jgi:hypothetical protein
MNDVSKNIYGELLYTIFLKLKMKIAFLTPEYPTSFTGNSGGIGTSIKNLAVGLVAGWL